MIKIGKNSTIDETAIIGENVTIGNNVTVYPNVILDENVFIWDNCVIGRVPMGVNSILSKVESSNEPTKICKSSVIGCGVTIYNGTTIGEESLISENVVIRERCHLVGENIIGPNSFIQKDCKIGRKTRINQLVTLAPGTTTGSNNFLSSGFICVSDKTFGIDGYSDKMIGPTIGNHNLIGPNVTMLDNLVVGDKNIIGAKSLVTKSIGNNGVYYGIPAKYIKERK